MTTPKVATSARVQGIPTVSSMTTIAADIPALRAAAGLAAAMGVGRFVYTPILPLMQQQAGLSPGDAAFVATANYLGYFLGAIALTVWSRWNRSRGLFRSAMVALVLSELLMAATGNTAVWVVLRLIAGMASAVVFVICTTGVLSGTTTRRGSPGIAYTGVGIGIAASGLLVALLEELVPWSVLWLLSAALTLAFVCVAWRLEVGPAEPGVPDRDAVPVRLVPRGWSMLMASYFLEGVGYIILGTFLVAGISAGGKSWTGPAAWVLVGLAAAPSSLLWGWLRRRATAEILLVFALVLQVASALIPAMFHGIVTAAVSALLFGGTFMGITMLAMLSGSELHMPRSAALLTAVYGLGQVIGPLAVAPLLSTGYDTAFLTGGGVLALSAIFAVLTRHRRRSAPTSSLASVHQHT